MVLDVGNLFYEIEFKFRNIEKLLIQTAYKTKNFLRGFLESSKVLKTKSKSKNETFNASLE
ncbi:hypothetical protein AYB34_13890 [Leptospira sp. ZV016]|nr:hypothetical protein LEP1GSC166_0924 [Leptospira kirschneri]KXZ32261.1 hypothetical protein AYB34_13890 [Leptospira sp. ZV016]